MNVTIELDKEDLKPWLGADPAISLPIYRVVKMAGGDALRRIRVDGKRRVRDRKRIKASFLANKALPLEFPRGQRLGDLVWTMRVSGTPVALSNYKVSQTKAGVKVQVNADKAPILIKSAFIATMKSGHRGVWVRRAGVGRLPIHHALSSRVSDAMRDEPLLQYLMGRAHETFRSTFQRLLPLELAKAKK
jgi:hypothetical protein